MLDGLLKIKCNTYSDDRGFFTELYNVGNPDIPKEVKNKLMHLQQVNISHSKLGVIRGMHYQTTLPMGKFFRVITGAVYLVELDIRKESATFGQTEEIYCTADDPYAIWIPYGFANGFLALENNTTVAYICDTTYNPASEFCINPMSESLRPIWASAYQKYISPSIAEFIISEKDKKSRTFEEIYGIRLQK